MDNLYARHGDLVIVKEAVPAGFQLEKPKAPVVLAGREDAAHTIAKFKDIEHGTDGEVQRLRVLRDVELTHGARHNTINLEPGDYALWPLGEMSGEIARRVED